MPILILLVFTIAFGTAMYNMQDSRSKAIEEVVDDTNFADGFVYFDPLNQTTVDFLLKNGSIDPYFDDFEMRMMLVVKFEISKEEYDGILLGIDMSRESHINALINKEKKEIDDYKFAFQMNFAEENNIRKGDKISISYGSVEKKIEIGKIGYNPEFQFVPLYKNIAFPSLRPYPILYVDINYLNQYFLNQTTPLVNQVIYKLDDKSDQDDVKDLFEQKLGNHLQNIISQDEHPFIKSMREDEKNDRVVIFLLTGVLLCSAIITLILVTYKLVEDDLKSVSVFQALGANKREILVSYLTFNLILITLAIILGILLSFLINIPINNLMLKAMNIPIPIEQQYSINNSLEIGLVLFIIAMSSTLILVKRAFKMDVQQTLKYETKFLEKINLIEKFYRKMKTEINPFTLYNIRRVFGRKLHLISIIVALSFSASLLIFFYSFQDSLKYSINYKFDTIEKWDFVANTWQYENKDNMSKILDSINEIKDYEYGITGSVLFSKKEHTDFNEFLRIEAFEEDSKLHLTELEDGKKLKKNRDALVTKDIISKFNLKIGDSIYVKQVGSDDSKRLTIVGIVNDISSMTLILSIDKSQDIFNKTGKINTIYFTSDKVDEAAEDVLDLPQIEQVSKMKEIKVDIDYYMELASTMFTIFGVLFFAFGFILLMVIFKSIIDYRMEDYSNMKAIGLLNSEIGKNLFLEMLVYFLFSIAIGLLMGSIIMSLIIQTYSSILPGLRFYLYPLSYAYYSLSFSIILISSYIYNFYRIKKINIAEKMREKTFG
ncbi:MAG: FtsX-like permease family protein [Promethearchaeota archaeon]